MTDNNNQAEETFVVDDLLDEDENASGLQQSEGFSQTALGSLTSQVSDTRLSNLMKILDKDQGKQLQDDIEPSQDVDDQSQLVSKDEATGSTVQSNETDTPEVATAPEKAPNAESKSVDKQEDVDEVNDTTKHVNENSSSDSELENEPPKRKNDSEEDEPDTKKKLATEAEKTQPQEGVEAQAQIAAEPKFTEHRHAINEHSLSPSENTSGGAPLDLSNNSSYNKMYRTRRSLNGTMKCLRNKNLKNFGVGNDVTYTIDEKNNCTKYHIDVFRTHEKIEVTESDKHLEFEGGNYKEQATILVNYANNQGWLDLAVWGDSRFIEEVKKLALQYDITVLPVDSRDAALNVKVVPKQEFELFSSPSLGKHRAKQPASPASSSSLTNSAPPADPTSNKEQQMTRSTRPSPQKMADSSMQATIKKDNDQPSQTSSRIFSPS